MWHTGLRRWRTLEPGGYLHELRPLLDEEIDDALKRLKPGRHTLRIARRLRHPEHGGVTLISDAVTTRVVE